MLLRCWDLWCGRGLGLGGVGGHANVPCTSYMIYCHVAKISGIAYYVTCCYAAEMSCYTCVAGSEWQLAVEDSFHTDGSLSRRRVLKKIWASTSDAHDVYLDLSKINRFCIHFFFNQNSVIQRVRKSILYCKLNYRWLWLSWKQTIKTLARFPFRRDVYNILW